MQIEVPFNRPLCLGGELEAIGQALASGELAGNGPFTKACESWLRQYTGSLDVLLTSSCSHALEMAAILIGVGPGDEVIMPSWTFVSTANAFVLRGATPVFVDIRPDTCNIDESLIERAITSRTRAIVPVHYGGVACDMDAIMDIADRHGLWVIEDAAQALMSFWRGKALGAIGHLGAYSFHATKNYTSGGEGGALLVNHSSFLERAEIIREKGTNRSEFCRGRANAYEWLDIGSSFLQSEVQAACLSVQLQSAEIVNSVRSKLWGQYYSLLTPVCAETGMKLPAVPDGAVHNGHLFYLRTSDRRDRDQLLATLNKEGILARTHYEPLHISPAGKYFGRFSGPDICTLQVHETLLRLPIYYALSAEEQRYVVGGIQAACSGM